LARALEGHSIDAHETAVIQDLGHDSPQIPANAIKGCNSKENAAFGSKETPVHAVHHGD
jgi:hypothetical protein